jgi:hypothetical protein
MSPEVARPAAHKWVIAGTVPSAFWSNGSCGPSVLRGR